MVRVMRLGVVSRVVSLLVVALLILRRADDLLNDLHAGIVLGTLVRVGFEVLGGDQGSEEEAVEGLADGVRTGAVDRALLLHDVHLVFLAVHTANKLVYVGVVSGTEGVDGGDDVLGRVAVEVRNPVGNNVQGTDQRLGVLFSR